MRADLPPAPAPPVHVVMVEVHASGPNLRLSLYSSTGDLVGEASLRPDPIGCPLPYRGLLTAPSSVHVAYARIGALPDPPPPGCEGDGCGECATTVVIDNFTFGEAIVPVRATSWGTLKLYYR